MYVPLGTGLLPWHAVLLLHTFDTEHKCFSFFLTSILIPIKPVPDWSCESTSPSVFPYCDEESILRLSDPLVPLFLDRKAHAVPQGQLQDRAAGAQ